MSAVFSSCSKLGVGSLKPAASPELPVVFTCTAARPVSHHSVFVPSLLLLKHRTSHLSPSVSTWWLGPPLAQQKQVMVNCSSAVCHTAPWLASSSGFGRLPLSHYRALELPRAGVRERPPAQHNQPLHCPGLSAPHQPVY